MARVEIAVEPGVYPNLTQRNAGNKWIDSNLVRWQDGIPKTIPGWHKLIEDNLGAPIRAIHTWSDNVGSVRTAIATSQGLYVYYDGLQSYVDITPDDFVAGSDVATDKRQYGALNYGAGQYGAAFTSYTEYPVPLWSITNFGQYLVAANSSDGRIFYWDNDIASKAQVLPNSPDYILGLAVTSTNQLMAVGGENKKNVYFSDIGDFTTWASTQINKAGDITLPIDGLVYSVRKMGDRMIVACSSGLFLLEYFDISSVVWGAKKIADAAPISPNALVVYDDVCMWIDIGCRAWKFQGITNSHPSAVSHWMLRHIAMSERFKTMAFHYAEKREIWWLFPTTDTEAQYLTQDVDGNDVYTEEPYRYVIYNYHADIWYIGQLQRSGVGYSSADGILMMGDKDGYVHLHERGSDREGVIPYLASGEFLLTGDRQHLRIDDIYVDEDVPGAMKVTLRTRNWSNNTSKEMSFVASANKPNPIRTGRMRGRFFSIKLESSAIQTDWALNNLAVESYSWGVNSI